MAKTVSAPTAKKPTHEEIAQRARAIYERSGCMTGRDIENWLQAEAELTAAPQPPPREQGKPTARNSARTTTARAASPSNNNYA
jgi:hypothetical protein